MALPMRVGIMSRVKMCILFDACAYTHTHMYVHSFTCATVAIALSKPRHSMTTRFLLTCISSHHFHKEATLDGLHGAIAQDAANLYWKGLEVS